MASLNRWTGIGNCGSDPKLDYTPSGTARCRLSVATTEKYQDKSGTKQESTTWHNIVLWGQPAEFAGEHVKKGSLVYIEGRIQNREYEKDGETKKITEVVANVLQLLGGGGRDEDDAPPEPRRARNGNAPPQSAKASGGSRKPAPEAREEEDDLPF